jgi:hypothetical protein
MAKACKRGMHIGFWCEKPEGMRPLGKPRRTWEDNIKIGLCETAWGGMDQTDLLQDWTQRRALMDTVMNIRVLQNVGKYLRS